MDTQLLATVFIGVFIAELGDKTQIATMLFASKEGVSVLTVFIGAAAALIASTAVGVLAGAALSQFLQPRVLATVAGCGFIAIGCWSLWQAWMP